MADENKFSDDDKGTKKGGEFRVPPRTWVVWIAIIVGIVALVFFKGRMEAPSQTLKPNDFMAKVDSNLIASATISYSPQSPLQEISGFYYKTDADGVHTDVKIPFHTKLPLTEKMVDRLIA